MNEEEAFEKWWHEEVELCRKHSEELPCRDTAKSGWLGAIERVKQGQEPVVSSCRGYALLGTGKYLLNHSADFDSELGVELIVTLATEADKAGNRQVGEMRDNPLPPKPMQANEMVIRIGFLNEQGLYALQNQLTEISKKFFSEHPAPQIDTNWEPNKAKEWDYNLHTNPDASAWAEAFSQTFPNCGVDEGLMIGWFANAMMAMHDHLKSQQTDVAELVEALKYHQEQTRPIQNTIDALAKWEGKHG